MKTHLFVLATLLSFRLFGQAIPNGGFENWNNGTYQEPQYYQSSDADLSGVPALTYTANEVRVSPGYHGSYAVQLSTITIGSDTIFGYIVDGSPDKNSVYGGIPYAQKPTGIRFYYKYSTTTTDSAMVMAWFKKSGSVIGTYVFKVNVLSGTFKLYSGTFSPALAATPDTVVFGATSSSFDIKNKNSNSGKPGSVFTIDSVSFTGVGSQPARLNGDFENWNPVDTFFLPAGWYPQPPVRWSNDRHSGNLSVQLNTVFDSNRGRVVAGMVSTGYWNCNGNHCIPRGGYPYTQTQDSISFWYKYTPAGIDTAWMNVNFVKDTAFAGTGMSLFNTSGQWVHAAMQINVPSTPDTAIVSFGSSNSGNNGPLPSHIGSVLRIDNVQFKSQPLTVSNLTMPQGSITVYPNPAHGLFQVYVANYAPESTYDAGVYNILGERILSIWNLKGLQFSLDLSTQPNGMYLLRIINANGEVIGVQKIIKL
jgi:hypothetical protein